MRWVMVCGAVLVLALALGVAWFDAGEVVVLHTVDASGRASETPLWFVDLDGSVYVRAASPDAGWLERLRQRPSAHVSRNGESWPVRAVAVQEPGLRGRLNRAMSEKYGRLSRLVEWIQGGSDLVPVRLDPAQVAAGTSRP